MDSKNAQNEVATAETWTSDAACVLDVRPDLAAGGDPLSSILEAAASIPAQQSLVVIAPFEPVPLYGVLGAQGFTYTTAHTPDDAWTVRFTRA